MKHRCVLILQPRARDTHTRARETERERERERESKRSLPPSFRGAPNAPAQSQRFAASVTERGIAREGAHPHRPLAAAAAAARSPATAARRRRRQAAAAPPVRHRPAGRPVLSAPRPLQTRARTPCSEPVGQSERERETLLLRRFGERGCNCILTAPPLPSRPGSSTAAGCPRSQTGPHCPWAGLLSVRCQTILHPKPSRSISDSICGATRRRRRRQQRRRRPRRRQRRRERG